MLVTDDGQLLDDHGSRFVGWVDGGEVVHDSDDVEHALFEGSWAVIAFTREDQLHLLNENVCISALLA